MTDKPTVIYNDSCPICSREVAGYRRMAERDGVELGFAGLSEGAHADHGLTRDQAARRFHVVKDGTLYSGLPAFAVLWAEMPRLRWLARLVRLPGLSHILGAAYDHLVAPALYALHRRRQRRAESVSGKGRAG
ncbi:MULTISPECIES: thiol-disulfide oxidoreductase DCC family protein [unclassified Mameliella]|uniref:thiol-disulfide oxidoreductase DCC family protein n=1 Tax=unclassified Mameliella TaxID=2630630 RepID=UPI00273FBD56|nr:MULTISPECIES: DUF393 domain-containing protein [unclassified Mameliella]